VEAISEYFLITQASKVGIEKVMINQKVDSGLILSATSRVRLLQEIGRREEEVLVVSRNNA